MSALALNLHGIRIAIKPSDKRLRTLNCRRTTFEMVVRKYAESLSGIRIQSRTKVTGILLSDENPATVTGVRFERAGKAETLIVDAVIDASGRSGKLARLLQHQGIRFNEMQRDSGLLYFTRHHQLKRGCDFPKFMGLPGARFADFTSGAFPAHRTHLKRSIQC